MRRRGQPQSGGAAVSLFPFLAVLLCTMGALIVVLVVIARQARLKLAEDDGACPPLRSELETKQADLQWRIEMLRESQAKTQEQLETQRAELGHLEDHARRLQRQLEELEGARRQFAQLASGGDKEGDRLRREIAEIDAKIADKQKELERAIEKAGKGGNSYAVVAYHGPNETRRRPIYIECRGDGVVFQPEGLVLTERDFEIDLGPGSPMNSALRAAREHLAHNQLPGEEGTPYPLLLVRPDGIAAYGCAHETLKNSGSEFGYELIGQDWPLEYPPADPQLTLAMRRAIGEGRLRQAYMAHAAPQLRESGPRVSFRASPRGGLMRDDGQQLGGDSRAGMHGRRGGRPSFADGGQRYDDRYAGHGTGSGSASDQAKSPKNRGENPYRAALASQAQSVNRGAAAGRNGDGGGANGGSGTTAGAGAGGGGRLGVGAGDFAAGQLNAALDSPTGVLMRAGHSGGTAGGGAQGAGAKPGGTGRGWGAGQDKVAAVAAGLGGSEMLDIAGKGGAGNGNKPGGGEPGGDRPAAGGRGSKNAQGGGPNGNGPQQGAPGDGGPELQPASQFAGESPARGTKEGPLATAGGPGGARGAASGNAAASNSAGDALTKGTATGGSANSGASASGGRSAATSGSGKSSPGGGASQGGSSSNASSGNASSGGSSAGGQPQQPMIGMPAMPNMTLGQKRQSIAAQRGEKNWANPSANHSSFPVTRTIKIVCDADHLTLLPEGRSRRGFKVIELGEHSEDGLRELVSAVWDRVETWGVAGQGMYWRPELIMEVEPGGEQRFNELKALMADSGLDVRGRPRRGPVINYPRTKTPN